MDSSKIDRIAVMTAGGDCPGLNAVIRAVVKTAISSYGLDVWGIEDGYLGLIQDRIKKLTFDDASNILTAGGTILGSSNKSNPFKFGPDGKDVSDDCINNLKKRGIDALICIGGDGTMASAADFADKGLTVIGVPKTIDNDLWGTDITFGFDTAVQTATEAIDKLHTTASSHHRVMVIEVMGRYAGWLALYSGVAGGADVILIPEMPFDIDKVIEVVKKRNKKGRRYSLIVVGEGAKIKGGKEVVKKTVSDSPDPVRLGGIGEAVSDWIQEKANIESRAVVLGHIQRGGTPTAADRALATGFGYQAVEYLMQGKKNLLVVKKQGKLSSIGLSEVAGKVRTVPKDHHLVKSALAVETSFGT